MYTQWPSVLPSGHNRGTVCNRPLAYHCSLKFVAKDNQSFDTESQLSSVDYMFYRNLFHLEFQCVEVKRIYGIWEYQYEGVLLLLKGQLHVFTSLHNMYCFILNLFLLLFYSWTPIRAWWSNVFKEREWYRSTWKSSLSQVIKSFSWKALPLCIYKIIRSMLKVFEIYLQIFRC